MTNTLHRYGTAESFVDDYIVFSLPAKSKAAGQQGDALAAQKRFMELAVEYKPISLGDALKGGVLRPTKSTSIFGHWGKRNKPSLKAVLDGTHHQADDIEDREQQYDAAEKIAPRRWGVRHERRARCFHEGQ